MKLCLSWLVIVTVRTVSGIHLRARIIEIAIKLSKGFAHLSAVSKDMALQLIIKGGMRIEEIKVQVRF